VFNSPSFFFFHVAQVKPPRLCSTHNEIFTFISTLGPQPLHTHPLTPSRWRTSRATRTSRDPSSETSLPSERIVTKCRRDGGLWPGPLATGHSDDRGPTTCRAALVTDNPGLPRAPPGVQYRGRPPATHPPLPTRTFAQTAITGWAGKRRRGTRLHGRRSVSVSSLFPSQMQRGRSSAGGNPVRQLYRAGEIGG
jgi:hypothetical protein